MSLDKVNQCGGVSVWDWTKWCFAIYFWQPRPYRQCKWVRWCIEQIYLRIIIRPSISHKEVSHVARSLTNGQKYKLLTDHLKSSTDFIFPQVSSSGCNRSFQHRWLEKDPWLVYNKVVDGGFFSSVVLCLPETSKLGIPVNNHCYMLHKVVDGHASNQHHMLRMPWIQMFNWTTSDCWCAHGHWAISLHSQGWTCLLFTKILLWSILIYLPWGLTLLHASRREHSLHFRLFSYPLIRMYMSVFIFDALEISYHVRNYTCMCTRANQDNIPAALKTFSTI